MSQFPCVNSYVSSLPWLLGSCTKSALPYYAGELFAMCPVDAHPGVAVEPVSDSSRYFVLRLADPSGMW